MKYCPNCQKQVKHKYNIFCDQSCAATYNNKNRPRLAYKTCKYCDKVLYRRTGTYCNYVCQKEYVYQEYITRWKAGLETGNGNPASKIVTLSRQVRRYIKEKYLYKCARCSWCEIHPITKVSPLEIDHIDGNAFNSVEDNLILLCPNCHSLTPTYRALNRTGNARVPKAIYEEYLDNSKRRNK